MQQLKLGASLPVNPHLCSPIPPCAECVSVSLRGKTTLPTGTGCADAGKDSRGWQNCSREAASLVPPLVQVHCAAPPGATRGPCYTCTCFAQKPPPQTQRHHVECGSLPWCHDTVPQQPAHGACRCQRMARMGHWRSVYPVTWLCTHGRSSSSRVSRCRRGSSYTHASPHLLRLPAVNTIYLASF